MSDDIGEALAVLRAADQQVAAAMQDNQQAEKTFLRERTVEAQRRLVRSTRALEAAGQRLEAAHAALEKLIEENQ